MMPSAVSILFFNQWSISTDFLGGGEIIDSISIFLLVIDCIE